MTKYPASVPSLGEAEARAVADVVRSGWITQGAKVQEFEAALSEILDTGYVVACSSGTAALHLALAALGIGPGDEVLVPDLSYVATANAVAYTGAKPVLVDAEFFTWGLDISKVRITERTKAIVITHLYGVPCDMDAIFTFALQHELPIIEDAAEAFGADWRGHPCGSLGLCGTFSFYGNKIITTGEGGAVVTDNAKLAETLRFLRGQAQSSVRRFWHAEVGFNYRMTDVAAAIGLTQLNRLTEFLRERRRVVLRYRQAIGDLVRTPFNPHSAPWLYTGVLPEGVRHDVVATRLADAGIETRPVFVPMHRLPMYAGQPDSEFPVSSKLADQGISLPTYPDLRNEDVDQIVRMVIGAVGADYDAYARTGSTR